MGGNHRDRELGVLPPPFPLEPLTDAERRRVDLLRRRLDGLSDAVSAHDAELDDLRRMVGRNQVEPPDLRVIPGSYRETGPHRRWMLWGVPSLVVAAVLALTLTLGGGIQGVGIYSSVVAWRVAGVLAQPNWAAAGSGPSTAQSAVVSCPTRTRCFSVVGADQVLVSSSAGSKWASLTLPGGWLPATSTSCPRATTCFLGAAPEKSGHDAVLQTDDGGAQWKVHRLPPWVAQLVDLACPSSLRCMAIGFGSAGSTQLPVAITTTNAGGSWSVSDLPGPFAPEQPGGLACPSPTSCVAVGATSYNHAHSSAKVLRTTDWGTAWLSAKAAGTVQVRAVACEPPGRCVAVGNRPAGASSVLSHPYGPSDILTSANGGRTWRVAAKTNYDLTAVSCGSVLRCWVAGSTSTRPGGRIMVTSDGGNSWMNDPLPKAPGTKTGLTQLDIDSIGSISCPSATTCVALGAQASTTGELQVVLRNTSASRRPS